MAEFMGDDARCEILIPHRLYQYISCNVGNYTNNREMINPVHHANTTHWVGTSRVDLKALPKEVREDMGYALYEIENGNSSAIAKPLKGFGGASVQQLSSKDIQGNAYRTICTVKFSTGVYVLHVFQKKSKSGIATPKAELDKVKQRLKDAENIHNAIVKKRTIQ